VCTHRWQVIGTGKFADVRECLRKADGQPVALKFIDKLGGELDLDYTNREASIMMELRHPNVLHCFAVLETPGHVILSLELAGKDLFSWYVEAQADPAASKEDRSERAAVRHIRDVLEGLRHLHQRGIAHRDLKLENLLVGEGGVVKLCDFGFAKSDQDHSPLRTLCGTMEYAAPEVLLGEAYSQACDVWSLGVVCYLMLSKQRPFWHEDTAQLIQLITKEKHKHTYRASAWKRWSLHARGFIDACLVKCPEQRSDCDALIATDWMDGVKPTPLPSLKAAERAVIAAHHKSPSHQAPTSPLGDHPGTGRRSSMSSTCSEEHETPGEVQVRRANRYLSEAVHEAEIR
jgi:serine/threonine protein kinase